MNIALVGYGYWGKVWKSVLARVPEVTLTHVFHRNAANDGLFTNDRSMLLSPEVQGVILASPVSSHVELAAFFLTNGKHVLCEKPLALTRHDAVTLTELARRKGLVLETNFTYLHSPTIQHMTAVLHRIGQVYAMESNIDGFGNFYRNEDVYSVHCPHILALIADLFPDEPFAINTYNLVFSRLGTVDVGNIQLASKRLAINVHSSLRGITRQRRIVFYGSEGVMEYDAMAPEQFKLTSYTEQGERLVQTSSSQCAFDETQNIEHSFRKFLSCIRNDCRPNDQVSVRVSTLLEHILQTIKRPKHAHC